MFSFKIITKSKKSRARLGVISTPHGEIETPAFVPVATRATVRTLDSAEVAETGSQLLICNTFHLHTSPGEQLIKKAGGLHAFMQWSKPLMTDSGGFQVFSFGFGSDHGVGKVLKKKGAESIEVGTQPKAIQISEHGVTFRSPRDGKQLFLGPKESIRIQEGLGADIIFAFDECPSPLSSPEYLRKSLDTTHRWAKECLDAKRNKKQALYGIVQGGASKELRTESAHIIGAMDFEGFGIGGEFGYDKRSLASVLGTTTDALPQEKPRHVLGIGHPEDFEIIAKAGGDTFDCIAPTHYARHGTIFTSSGRLDIKNRKFRADFSALDKKCACDVCQTYSRAYVASLFHSGELTGMKLATMHNLYYFNSLAKEMRKRIKNGDV